jgi:hypothetical protein
MVRKNSWLVVLGGLFVLAALLVGGLIAWWHYANEIPTYTPAAIVMPVPNAYDDYVAAGEMCRAAGGSQVSGIPGGRGYGGPASGPPGSAPPGYPGPPGSISPGMPSAPPSRRGPPRWADAPDVTLAELRAVVARNRRALQRMRQGFRYQFRNPPVVSFSQPYPELAEYRDLARVLRAEGKLAEREGRTADAARSYLDILRLGTDIPRGGTLIHGLVGLAVQSLGLGALQELPDRLDPVTAGATARAMVALEARMPAAADVLAGEKEAGLVSIPAMFRQPQNPVQFVRSMTGSGSGPLTWDELRMGVRFAFIPKRRLLEDYRRTMDARIAYSRRPWNSPGPLPRTPADPLDAILVPAYSITDIAWSWLRRDAYWRILELRLAARAYQARHGAPPASPALLVPDYLPAIPRDPFAPRHLVYRVQRGRALIYSRGYDGKDDGGRNLEATAGPGSKGDLVRIPGRRNGGR